MRATTLKRISQLLPNRLLNRPLVQIVRARLAARERMRRSAVGPGIPIVGQVALERSKDWRAEFAAALWSIAQEAIETHDRAAWMLCVGTPPEIVEDLYAIAVQADPLVQLHMLVDEIEAADFRNRYVPPASLREARDRVPLSIVEVLSRTATQQNTFARATSVRASAHLFVKQLVGSERLITIHSAEAPEIIANLGNGAESVHSFRLLVVGDPLQASEIYAANPRIVIARRVGFSLLDELALVRVCDGYIGRPDHYAIVAADAGIPCLIQSEASKSVRQESHVRFAANVAQEFRSWMLSSVSPGL